MSEQPIQLTFQEIISILTNEQRLVLGNIFREQHGYHNTQTDTFIFTCDQQEFDAALLKIKLALHNDAVLEQLLSKLSLKGSPHSKETQEYTPIGLPEGPYEN